MCQCIVCGKKTDADKDYSFHVLKVRTLKVRDLDREKRVQALGDFYDYAVCRECAGLRLKKDLDPFKAAARRLAGFSILLIVGIILCILTFRFDLEKRIFLVLGICAAVCGVLGDVSSLQEAQKRKEELKKMPEKKALRESAWEELKTHAPARENDENITYIPADADTMKWKKGDLMILYELLPEIAVQAYDKIHQEYHS